jgi:iron complex outermembrane recepter protein
MFRFQESKIIGSLVLALPFGTAAWAQQAAVPAGDSTGIQEIIVTAQRREENLQSVPLTVSAFNVEALSAANVTSGMELYKLDSGVVLQEGYGVVTPFLRGIGSPLLSVGSEPSVAVYLDGVYNSRISPLLLRLNNIERVEVLDGPQGTLFGRNSSGGLINIITSDPKLGQEAALRGSIGYGNYNTVDATMLLSLPLGQAAAAEIAAVTHDQNKGWGYDPTTRRETFKDHSSAVRGKLAFALGDATHGVLTLEAGKSDADPIGTQTHGAPPAGYPDGSGKLPQIGLYDRLDNSPDSTITHTYAGTLKLDQEMSFATISNTFSLRRTPGTGAQDIDLSPQNYNYTDLQRFYANELSDELRLISIGTGPFKWTAGLYYFQTHQGFNPQALSGSLYGPTYVDFEIIGQSMVKSYAAYAQGTLQLGAATNLTLGIRDTHDKVSGEGEFAFCPQGLDGPCTATPGTFGSASSSYSKPTWKAALDHNFTADIMSYLSVSRGYKSAAFNTLPFSPTLIRPEVIDAYEVGVKSELFSRRVRFNGAVFYYDYKDPQITTVPTINLTEVRNAGSAVDKGVDFTAEALPIDNLSLRLGMTYLDTYYKKFDNAPVYDPDPNPPYGLLAPFSANVAGNRLVRAPQLTLTTGFQYTIPMVDGGRLVVGGNYYRNSGFYWDADNRLKQPAYGVLDANLAYTYPKENITLRLWGSNLTGTEYYSTVSETGTSGGYLGIPAPPRTYGVAVDFRL